MRVFDRRSARQAVVALGVLLLHGALVWLFMLSPGIAQAPEDENAIEVVLLPRERSSAAGDTLPQIKPRLRVPPLPRPDTELTIPIELPPDTPPGPDRVDPGAIALTPAPAPRPPWPQAGSDDTTEGNTGAAQGPPGLSIVHAVQPQYPEVSIALRQQGNVIVALTLDGQGQAIAARVRRSSGFQLLDDAALKAARQWRFDWSTRTSAGSQEISLRMGFHLMDAQPLEVQAIVVPFDAHVVAQINNSALRHPPTPAANEELLRQTINRLVAAAALGHGAAPAARGLIDPSPVQHLRVMGTVLRKPDMDVHEGPGSQAAKAPARLLWYAVAVGQERSTSEWLLCVEGVATIKAVEVMSGGPACSSAPRSPACSETP